MRRALLAATLLAGCGTATPATLGPSSRPHRDDPVLAAPQPTTTTTREASKPVNPPRVTVTTRAARSRPTIAPLPRRATGLNWAALRQCESGGNYANKRNPTFRGAYQFSLGTWRSVGGTGDPADASPAEQDMRAEQLYASRGRAPWPFCGRFL